MYFPLFPFITFAVNVKIFDSEESDANADMANICTLDLRLKLTDKAIVAKPLTGRLTRMLLTNNNHLFIQLIIRLRWKCV